MVFKTELYLIHKNLMQDIIRREVTIKSTKEKVYDAIANPEKVVLWFADAIEGSYAVGEYPLFVFEGHGKAPAYIVDAKPFEYFAYRWIPGGSDFVGDVTKEPNTLVEFHIQEVGEVCKVIMTESGFSKLPVTTAEAAFKQNSGGWDYMLGSFEKYLNNGSSII